MRVAAMACALAGGICLVARLFVGLDWLTPAGLVVVGLAAAVVGAGLARTTWLAMVSAVGAASLGWAVLEAGRALAPDREVDALLGGVATLCVFVAVLRTPVRRPGNHRS